MEKALVLLSGGLDSAVTLALAISRFGKDNVQGLSIYYGQRHNKELECAKKLAAHYGVSTKELDLSSLFYDRNCSLLQDSKQNVPSGSYAELHQDKPISTYVPFRNGLFLSVAASLALQEGCSIIYYGIHADEGAGNAYPDTSLAFHQAMQASIAEGSGHQLRLEAPFVSNSKAEIVKKGMELNVPFELTWSCYNDQDHPCMHCPTCIDRQKAFEANGIKDPLLEE